MRKLLKRYLQNSLQEFPSFINKSESQLTCFVPWTQQSWGQWTWVWENRTNGKLDWQKTPRNNHKLLKTQTDFTKRVFITYCGFSCGSLSALKYSLESDRYFSERCTHINATNPLSLTHTKQTSKRRPSLSQHSHTPHPHKHTKASSNHYHYVHTIQ